MPKRGGADGINKKARRKENPGRKFFGFCGNGASGGKHFLGDDKRQRDCRICFCGGKEKPENFTREEKRETGKFYAGEEKRKSGTSPRGGKELGETCPGKGNALQIVPDIRKTGCENVVTKRKTAETGDMQKKIKKIFIFFGKTIEIIDEL